MVENQVTSEANFLRYRVGPCALTPAPLSIFFFQQSCIQGGVERKLKLVTSVSQQPNLIVEEYFIPSYKLLKPTTASVPFISYRQIQTAFSCTAG